LSSISKSSVGRLRRYQGLIALKSDNPKIDPFVVRSFADQVPKFNLALRPSLPRIFHPTPYSDFKKEQSARRYVNRRRRRFPLAFAIDASLLSRTTPI